MFGSHWRKSLIPLILTVLLVPPGIALGQGGLDLGGFGGGEPLIDVASVFSITSAAPGQTYRGAVTIDIEPSWHINSADPHEDWLIAAKVEFDTIDILTPDVPNYPEGEDMFLAGDTMSVYSGSVVIPFDIAVAETASEGNYSLPVRFTYQPCNDTECRAPQTVDVALDITVGEEGQAKHTAIFAAVDIEDDPEVIESGTGETPVEEPNELSQLIEKYGTWGYVLALGLAFVTGLVLSFSPCTYPMIPITVSIFAGQQRSVGKGFALSLVYVTAMAVVYGIMGLIVSMVGGVFGAWLASTPVVIGIVIIFIAFSLSMFGLYELQVPMSIRQKFGSKAGGGGVFSVMLLGVVAALVVSPCVGPFVAGILIYIATAGSPVIGFLVLFVFAMGLGALYIIIGTFSSAINKLPNSGEWMEQVKKFFGFVLLLMALYFLRTIISPSLTATLASLLLLAFGVFGGGFDRLTPESGFFPRLKKFLGIIAILVGAYLLVGTILTQGMILPPASHWLPVSGSGTSAEAHRELIDWETDLQKGLARAERENKPVLIDTWATWCANCRVLDEETFGNPEVADEAKKFVPIKVQLENADTEITKDFMARFGMTHYSLPTTLLLDPDGNVRRIMRGVIGPEDMIAEMRKLH